MPLYLDIDRGEARATTLPVMAAIEKLIGWMLFGPRQHESDLRWSLGAVPRESLGEALRESGAAK